ncbi:hypothetical protein BC941DRAFT_407516 [Chlamydoabsidia padenii]|nr:hypothetical protein BC941DRAFT_407516 [Chlamydoabsidia padenii]
MKTQTLLLGEYASSNFYIYIIPSNNATPSSPSSSTTTDYLSVEDLFQLFFHHSSNDINPLLYSLYHQYPHHFYYDQKKTCYIAKQHVLDLARSLQLFALAEFCALSHDELIHRVADPLFAITNAVMLRPVTPKRMDIDLDWFPLPSNDDSFFSSFLGTDAPISYADHAATHTSNPDATYHPHLHFFSAFNPQKTNHSWTRYFLPVQSAGRTFRAQKQQQAIIECRMRLLVYRQSLPAAIKQKQQTKKSASPVNTSITPIHQYQHHHQQQKKRKSSPPSPPPFYPPSKTSYELDRDYYHSRQQPSKDHHHQKRLKSLYSNLDLLATQATKMKGLPLSPEISPPPPSVLSLPPISTSNATSSSFYPSSFIQSISLPSIRKVLSDI